MKFAVAFLAVFAFATVYAEDVIQCYQCISSTDKKCDSSDLNDLKDFNKMCENIKEGAGTYGGKSAVGCRKVVQRVEDDPEVIIRECAYSGAPVDGLKKTGNWAISKLYYQCENEKASEPCNGSMSLFSSSVLLVVASFIALFH